MAQDRGIMAEHTYSIIQTIQNAVHCSAPAKHHEAKAVKLSIRLF